jgi:Flp pilus assembly protein TadG
MLEFALVWPVLLLLVTGGIQLAVWSSEVFAAQAAAAAGARAGSAAGAGAAASETVALASLRPSLVGTTASSWCPGAGSPPPVWVCAQTAPGAVRVRVGGAVPALVPLLPRAGGMPLRADVTVATEAFR